jgi:hypothetical protein
MGGKILVVVLAATVSFLVIGQCWAWGAIGHEWISGIAIEQLSDSVPAFVRMPEAAAEIAVMRRELDRSKGAGETHDKERDPGHYVDLADDGSVMGVLPIDKLPVTREGYDTQLRSRASRNTRRATCPIRLSTAGSRSGRTSPTGAAM